jgi:hypothetical protein
LRDRRSAFVFVHRVVRLVAVPNRGSATHARVSEFEGVTHSNSIAMAAQLLRRQTALSFWRCTVSHVIIDCNTGATRSDCDGTNALRCA